MTKQDALKMLADAPRSEAGTGRASEADMTDDLDTIVGGKKYPAMCSVIGCIKPVHAYNGHIFTVCAEHGLERIMRLLSETPFDDDALATETKAEPPQ